MDLQEDSLMGMLIIPIIFNKAISSSQIQEKYYSGLNKLFKSNRMVLKEYDQRVGELRGSIVNNE